MGNTGKSGASSGSSGGTTKPTAGGFELVNERTYDTNDVDGVTNFNSVAGAEKWMQNPKMSNHDEWKSNLLGDEKTAVKDYTGSGYSVLNDNMYKTPWDEMDSDMKKFASDLYEAINKFELNKAIHTIRRCDFQIFGLPEGTKLSPEKLKEHLLKNTNDGYIQVNGFMSSTVKPQGTFANSHGVWIDIETPPNKGGGAYVSLTGYNQGEGEYLFNSNAILKFDPNSITMGDDGYVHINAKWVGQAKDQHFKKK